MRLSSLFTPHSFHHEKSYFLRYYSFLVYTLLFLAVSAAVIKIPLASPSVLGYATKIAITDIVAFTNQERAKNGAGQVVLNDELSKAAYEKAQDMFKKNYWAHFGPNGEKPWDFIINAGYRYTAAGENLARDFDDSESVVAAWMASPSHRENLVNKSYQDMGIAVVNGTLLGAETTLVVQMFGNPYKSAQIAANLPGSATADSAITKIEATQAKPLVREAETTPTLAQAPQVHLAQAEPVFHAGSPQSIVMGQQAKGVFGIPFELKVLPVIKTIAYGMLLFVAILLAIDTFVIRKRGVVRIATHSTSHIMVAIIVMVSILLIESGKIL